MQVQRALEDSGFAQLVAVMPGRPEQLRALRSALGLRVRLLSDPGWAVHAALGLARGSVRQIFLSPAAWWAYVRVIHRERLRRPTEDAFRLGGTAIVDAGGAVTALYRSDNPGDYADPADVVARLAELQPGHA